MSDLEVFKVGVRRGIQYLLPYARSNIMNMEKYRAEIALYLEKKEKNHDRVYEFPPYRMMLSFNEAEKTDPFFIASGSAPGRTGDAVKLSPEEEKAFSEVMADAFPNYTISSMATGLSAAFKVIGLPQGGTHDAAH